MVLKPQRSRTFRGSSVPGGGGGGAASQSGGPLGQLNYTGNTSDVANKAAATRCYTPVPLLINRIGAYIGVSSGNVDVGIYDANGTGGIPDAKLVSTGSIASPGTGFQLITIAETTIPAGFFWLSWAADNNTVSIGYFNATQWLDVYSTDTILGTTTRGRSAASAFPLPSTWPADAATALARSLWVERV